MSASVLGNDPFADKQRQKKRVTGKVSKKIHQTIVNESMAFESTPLESLTLDNYHDLATRVNLLEKQLEILKPVIKLSDYVVKVKKSLDGCLEKWRKHETT